MNWEYKLSRIALNHYRKKIENQVRNQKKILSPNYVLWDCTRRCNLNCEHCGATKEQYKTELSTNEVKKVIEDLALMKTRMFAVTGGEPLVRRDVLQILAFAFSQGLKTGIATNGFYIDRMMAEKIRESGVYSVQVSIDGLEHTHNKIRGNPNSFQKAVDAVKNLQEINVPILTVATTITPSNIAELEPLRELLINLEVKQWRISVIMPIGRSEKPAPFLLNKTQLKNLFSFVEQHPKSLTILIAENLPFLGSFEEKIRKEPFLCPVGITACCIGVDGNVRGCAEQPDRPEFVEGNVKNRSIIDIWQDKFKKYRLNETILKDKRCSECRDRYHCYGGCHVMRRGNIQCIYDLMK